MQAISKCMALCETQPPSKPATALAAAIASNPGLLPTQPASTALVSVPCSAATQRPSWRRVPLDRPPALMTRAHRSWSRPSTSTRSAAPAPGQLGHRAMRRTGREGRRGGGASALSLTRAAVLAKASQRLNLEVSMPKIRHPTKRRLLSRGSFEGMQGENLGTLQPSRACLISMHKYAQSRRGAPWRPSSA